ncbi:MAG TPA: BolA family transcriptional regulator [Alphaproteobacteria bacterium]|nr:BolA family transcriptional regulator [Alphaproteobacteria bacterium]HNS44030.1 BolA family transcriptional regulator [Alphaproteobacteria bacterium]
MAMSADEIYDLLKAGIPDASIEIKDTVGDSNHYEAKIVSPSFAGKSRIQQHQMVYQAIGPRVGNELHALSLKTSAE